MGCTRRLIVWLLLAAGAQCDSGSDAAPPRPTPRPTKRPSQSKTRRLTSAQKTPRPTKRPTPAPVRIVETTPRRNNAKKRKTPLPMPAAVEESARSDGALVWTPELLWAAADVRKELKRTGLLPNATGILDLHNVVNMARNDYSDYKHIQYGKNLTWKDNHDIVRENGHVWCSLVKPNWACFGEHYAAVLRATRPYQSYRFQLSTLPLNTRILADGNSSRRSAEFYFHAYGRRSEAACHDFAAQVPCGAADAVHLRVPRRQGLDL